MVIVLGHIETENLYALFLPCKEEIDFMEIYFACKYNTNMVKYGLRIQESNMDETPLQYANIAEDNMVG